MCRLHLTTVLLCALVCAVAVPGMGGARAAVPGAPACPVFPADNVLNTDISTLPVNAHSAQWLSSMGGPSRMLHPDFGPSGDPSVPYGIPYTVVGGSHPKVSVAFQYASESDLGPYPFGADTPIEGGAASTGDRHALMLESDTCTLYELYDAQYDPGGSTAGSGAIWSLRSDALRPAGWTSADAAGLPIMPLLLRPDEVRSGSIHHAIRVTAASTQASYLWPARHEASSSSNPGLPPMGARFRLRAGVDISHFSAAAQVVLTAFRHFGLIVADNGSNWYFQGSADPSWDPALISELKTIPASDFEAVDESSLMVDPDSGRIRTAPAATAPPPAPPAPTAAPTPRVTPPPTAPPHPRTPAAVALAPPPQPSPKTSPRPSAFAAPIAVDVRPATARSPALPISLIVAVAALFALAAGVPLRRRRQRLQARRNVPN